MTYEEARAQFPVLERLAYLQAGSVGPLARGTTEAMRAAEESGLHEGRGAVAQFTRLLEAREELRGEIAALVGVVGRQGRADCLDDRRLQHRRSPVSTCATGDEVITTTDEHFGLIGPLHASGATGRRRRARARADHRGGHAENAAHRPLARPLDDGRRAPGARAQGLHRAADPRRRSAVGRSLPRRRGRDRLLHDLRAEVALRAGGDRRARRRRARGAPRCAAELPLPAGVRERRTLRSEGRCGALRSEPDTDGVRRRVAGGDLSDPGLGARHARPKRRSASVRDWAMRDATSSSRSSAQRSSRGACPRRSRPTSSRGSRKRA